jgi:hypothetical protein
VSVERAIGKESMAWVVSFFDTVVALGSLVENRSRRT